jgi:hypothetical protein
MDNPGPFQLRYQNGAFPLASAGTFIGDWEDGFEGILALAAQFAFAFGSGSGTIAAYLQTSLDQGQSAIDIAAIDVGGTQVVNLSALTPRTTPLTPTQQALALGTCNDGILGSLFRAVVVVTGGYQGSSLNISGEAR